MQKIDSILSLAPELTLSYHNEIPILNLKHCVGEAKISLQGAQLLSWKPQGESHDLLWLSEIEPFQSGSAIRGGIPLCYPWFGETKKPTHGTARLSLWDLTACNIKADAVWLTFALFDEQKLQAELEMHFAQDLHLTFTHHGTEPAQAVLHSYFKVGEIAQVMINHLPEKAFNFISQEWEKVPTPRQIDQHTDCIYTTEQAHYQIIDSSFGRTITLTQQNASNLVLWNPWQTPKSAMQPHDYRQMLCLETGRIDQPLQPGEQMILRLSVED